MKLTFTLFLSILLSIIGYSQSNNMGCHHSEIMEKIKQNEPGYQAKREQLEEFTQRWISEQTGSVSFRNLVTIPVVVHVLYQNATQNISDAQITSQFDFLNKGFRKMNANFSSTPAAFQPLAADTEIEFCLATVDPSGNMTSGITRKDISNVANFNPDVDYYNATKGRTPWDQAKYLNVWIVTFGNTGISGFALQPTGDPGDGAVFDYRFWGLVGQADPNFLGTVPVHEFGHYFNLDHPWGAGNGGCNEDDSVSDTPLQNTSTSGCPSFPHLDNCTTSGNGIMYNNWMDYSDGTCLTMFTEGQKQRMLAALNGPRASLLTSNGCSAITAVRDFELDLEVNISPNPVQDILNISIEHTNYSDKIKLKIQLFNTVGKNILTGKIDERGGAQLDVSSLPSGIYFVNIKDTAASKFLSKKIVIQ